MGADDCIEGDMSGLGRASEGLPRGSWVASEGLPRGLGGKNSCGLRKAPKCCGNEDGAW